MSDEKTCSECGAAVPEMHEQSIYHPGHCANSHECLRNQIAALTAERDALRKKDGILQRAVERRNELLAWGNDRNKRMMAERDVLKADYHELIMSVETKYPDETRHQTALRYIQQAEQGNCTTSLEKETLDD